jgi:glycosyltransferase involved in cell wall biosynthesis
MFDYVSFASLAALKAARLHLRSRFDVVQVNSMPDFLVFAGIVPRLLGARLISMMYEPTPELWEDLRRSPAPLALKVAEQLSLAFAERSFTVTEQLKQAYVARGARAAKIQVVLNAPDEGFLRTEAAQPPAAPHAGSFTVICHGAIEERYGQDTILEAIALVREQIPGLRVRILGKGTYVDRMVEQIGRLHLEGCVEYLGYVSLEQMIAELRAADVGIVAQKSSPYSNLVHTGKMYEYMALGKPVLASRLRSVEAYFDEQALAYFEPADPHSLAAGLLDLYRHPEKRASLAAHARLLYDRYCWQEQKQIYLAVYRELTRRSVSRAAQQAAPRQNSTP